MLCLVCRPCQRIWTITATRIWANSSLRENLCLKQLLELATSQTTFTAASSLSRGLLCLFAIDKQFVQNAAIEAVGERQLHTGEYSWHQVKNFGIGSFKATLEVFAIGVKNAIFM